ncbi:MAG: DUF2007 domain-containing protein [Thermomicrobiales bacterium]
MTDDDLALLMTAPNEPLAAYWRDVLSDAGIPALVRPNGPGIGGWGSAALLAHDIFVRRSDLEGARELIAAEDGDAGSDG